MFGNNKILGPKFSDGNYLDVVSIFSTIQGEGPRAGQSAVFIRLGGCNLSCKFCDTEFDIFNTLDVSNIITLVQNETKKGLVVITGGEPLRQPIELLCTKLLELGYIVQIETNGTIYRKLPKEVEIICSPKTTQILHEMDNMVTAHKFLISAHINEYKDIKFRTNKPIYLQPIDEYDAIKNAANIAYVKELALKNKYHISLQLHKILNID